MIFRGVFLQEMKNKKETLHGAKNIYQKISASNNKPRFLPNTPRAHNPKCA